MLLKNLGFPALAALVVFAVAPASSVMAGEVSASVHAALVGSTISTLEKSVLGEFPTALKDMHARWLTYRDANCRLQQITHKARPVSQGQYLEAICRDQMDRMHLQERF